VQYGLTYGTCVLFSRALMAIPAHMGFAVLFGLFYGQAKSLALRGHGIGSGVLIGIGYLLSVFLHGLYDSAAMVQSNTSNLLFLLVVAGIYVIVFYVVRVAARHDRRFA
jgi:RsiW-degrading membrane proteinase PrsW (M82 family)